MQFIIVDNSDDNDKGKEPLVIVEKMADIKVMSIGINRPDKRNCVNVETSDLLSEAFEDFEHDEGMNTCVLHGIGGNFCSGFDLEELANFEEDLPNRLAAMLDRGPMVSR